MVILVDIINKSCTNSDEAVNEWWGILTGYKKISWKRTFKGVQNHVICTKNKSRFSLKMKCCRVIRMSSPNKPCSQDNLERVIDMQHCNPLIHQQFTDSKIQVVMAECSHLRATRQIQQRFFKLLCNRT